MVGVVVSEMSCSRFTKIKDDLNEEFSQLLHVLLVKRLYHSDSSYVYLVTFLYLSRRLLPCNLLEV